LPGQWSGENVAAGDDSPARYLPMRLNSIERFHLLDDWPAWPNWIGARLQFSGAIDESLGRAALEYVLRRHVRGGCGVDCSGPVWTWVERAVDTPLHMVRGGSADEWHLPPLPDPRSGRATQFAAWTDGHSSQVSFYVHHALADGLGALQGVREWMVVYDNLSSGRPPDDRLGPLDTRLLARRNELGLLRWSWWRHVWKQPVALFGASKFVFRRFARLVPGEAGVALTAQRAPSDRGLLLVSADVGPEMLRELRAKAKATGVSLNDWLTGCLFEALAEFRKETAPGRERDWLRIIVPISLRSKADAALPAANRTTLVQIDRWAGDFDPRVRLMQGIARELGIIRGWQLDRLFLLAIRCIGLSRGWLRHAARWQKQRATALLTNLGKPLLGMRLENDDGRLVVGGLRLNTLDLVAPVKHGMPVAFAAHQYRNALRITMQVDGNALSRERAGRLLELLVGRLGAS
jgi:hypothetical protein